MPCWANASKPPIGSPGSLGVLVSTPVWCGARPVKIEARLGQHSESTTNAFSYVAPSALQPLGLGHRREQLEGEVVHQHEDDVGPRVDVGGHRDRGVCGVTGDEEGQEGEDEDDQRAELHESLFSVLN